LNPPPPLFTSRLALFETPSTRPTRACLRPRGSNIPCTLVTSTTPLAL
jgi:hypothetical protein